jgi:pyruvate kinase
MVDLQGPKIRVGKFEQGKVLAKGAPFILDADCTLGDQERIGLDYRELPHDVRAGDTLLLDDGASCSTSWRCVRRRSIPPCATAVAVQQQGHQPQGGGLTAPALTEKDMEDIRTAAKLKVDFLAVSFPKSGADIRPVGARTDARGRRHALLIAKDRACRSDRGAEDISMLPTPSWSRAATSPWRWAMLRCRRCRSA